MVDLDVEQIRAVHAAASKGPYRWAGNTDYEDVRLAGADGSEVFAVIDHDRTVDDPQSRALANYLSLIRVKIDGEFRMLTDDEIAEQVRASIAYDPDEEQLPTYPVLAFYVPGFAYEHARDHVTYEVTRYQDLPEDTPRSHPKIYRADVCDVRNSNARFLRDSWAFVDYLLKENERLAVEGDSRREAKAALAEWLADLDPIEAAYDDFDEPTPSEAPDAPYNADIWTLRGRLREASGSGKALVAEVRRLRTALDDIHDWCDPSEHPTNEVARDVVEEVRYRTGVALGRRHGIGVGTTEDDQLRAEAKRFLAREAVVEHFLAEQAEFRRPGNGEARRILAERLAKVDRQLGACDA